MSGFGTPSKRNLRSSLGSSRPPSVSKPTLATSSKSSSVRQLLSSQSQPNLPVAPSAVTTPSYIQSGDGSMPGTPISSRPVSPNGKSIRGFDSPAVGKVGNDIRVVCRFRPSNEKELAFQAGASCYKILGDNSVEIRDGDVAQYTFDRLFGPNTMQEEVYQYIGKDMVANVLAAYNATIFSYGQTSSGKTYTMEGVLEDPVNRGLIPRVIDGIFEGVYAADSAIEFTIRVSMIEIYLEKIQDLLDTNVRAPVKIREATSGEVLLEGLTEIAVSNAEEIMELFSLGCANRHISATKMNEKSSRSHSIFIISINQNLHGTITNGKLYLVDLAGSEKVAKTGVMGLQMSEAKQINKSLSALGNVINALTDGSQHIPYRNSKLTRVLQQSLGGNARTALVIHCSPSVLNTQETVSTLRFGTRAKKITNKAHKNTELSVVQLKQLLLESETEVEKLRILVAKLEFDLTKKNLDGLDDKLSPNINSHEYSADMHLLEARSIIAQLNGTIQERDEQISSLIASLAEEEQSHRETEDLLKSKTSNFDAERSNFENQIEKFQHLLLKVESDESTKTVEHNSEEFQDLKEENASLKQQIATLRNQLASSNDKTSVLETPNQKLTSRGYARSIPTPVVLKEDATKSDYLLRIVDLETQLIALSLTEHASKPSNKDRNGMEDYDILKQQAIQQKLDFLELKNSFHVDLQDRCEKVVDLQQQLYDTNEKLKQFSLGNSSSYSQNSSQEYTRLKNQFSDLDSEYKKLTRTYVTLVEEHTELETANHILEKKLGRRNARIENLQLLVESAKDSSQNMHTLILKQNGEIGRLNREITQLQEAIKQIQQTSHAHTMSSTSKYSSDSAYRRIVKPIRGRVGTKSTPLTPVTRLEINDDDGEFDQGIQEESKQSLDELNEAKIAAIVSRNPVRLSPINFEPISNPSRTLSSSKRRVVTISDHNDS